LGSSTITRSVIISSMILTNPQTQKVGIVGRNVIIIPEI
jgi:hypothetical protein